MEIEAYILVHNEERLMPYIMRHYSQFAKVVILENNSTDRSVDIAHSMGATIWKYDIFDDKDELTLLDIRNNCWKDSKADWVIVVDADEFVYHPRLIKVLEKTNKTAFIPVFYNMFSDTFPITDGQIYEEVQYGSRGDEWDKALNKKMNLFKPSELTEINYGPGCHTTKPEGNVKIGKLKSLMTLHMRFLSRQYVIDNYKMQAQRISPINKENNWSGHYEWSEEVINKFFDDRIPNLIKVL